MTKLIDPTVLAALATFFEPGVHIGYKDEVTRIDPPKRYLSENKDIVVIKVVFASGFSITILSGTKYFEAFRGLPVGTVLSYTYASQRDARPWSANRKSDSGATFSQMVASNGDLEKFEVFAVDKGTVSEVFAGIMADPTFQLRDIVEGKKKETTGGSLGGIESLDEITGTISEPTTTNLPTDIVE